MACVPLAELYEQGRSLERLFAVDADREAALTRFARDLAAWHMAPDDERRALAWLATKMTPGMGWQAFLAVLVPLERVLGRTVTDAEFLIHSQDRTHSAAPSQPLHVVLDNIRSAFNVGTIFRTADALGVRHVYLCGYTPTPEHSRVAAAALGAEKHVPWSWHPHGTDLVLELQKGGITCAALETTSDSLDLFSFQPPKPLALVLGNERHGLSPQTIQACRFPLSVPMRGTKNSLNVGVAFAVTGYEVLRQWRQEG